MTEEEYKFLEVFYKRESIPEQSYINYISGSQSEDTDTQTKEKKIENLFSRFKDSGLIDATNRGIYHITPLGKEKFEELCAPRENIHQPASLPYQKTKPFHIGRKVGMAILILIIIISVMASTVINHWDYLMKFVHKILP